MSWISEQNDFKTLSFWASKSREPASDLLTAIDWNYNAIVCVILIPTDMSISSISHSNNSDIRRHINPHFIIIIIFLVCVLIDVDITVNLQFDTIAVKMAFA